MLFIYILSQNTFQSTLPRRERPFPAATESCGLMTFQSTLPRRERPRSKTVNIYGQAFQSTLPRRERQRRCVLPKINNKTHFNPRSREGSDTFSNRLIALRKISIHAPAKGATVTRLRQKWSLRKFQSTLPRRERPPPEMRTATDT